MWILRYGVPVLGILGFAHAAYQVFMGELVPEKMGVHPNVLRMFGVGEAFIAICWLLIIFGLHTGNEWPRHLAIFITGIYLCNYLVSLSMFKNMGDRLFKYWGTAGLVIMILYSWRI